MADDRPRVTIYTDGGADPNPGPGGWGVVLIHDATGSEKRLSGGEPDTTNNRMELTAAIRALESLTQSCVIRFFTDSEYLRLGITEWLPAWISRGWRRKGGAVQNADLWQRLAQLVDQHEITWQWVRGHTGNRYNELADRLAAQEIRRFYTGGQEVAAAEIFLVVSARGSQGMWAGLVRHEGDERLLTGRETGVTSNRLDLVAAIQALSALPAGVPVRVYSLSDYLRNGASQWIHGWKRRGWLTKDGQPVKSQDLWQRLDAELSARQVEWPSVKDDPALESVFEDLAYRAQEEIGQSDHPVDWADDD